MLSLSGFMLALSACGVGCTGNLDGMVGGEPTSGGAAAGGAGGSASVAGAAGASIDPNTGAPASCDEAARLTVPSPPASTMISASSGMVSSNSVFLVEE